MQARSIAGPFVLLVMLAASHPGRGGPMLTPDLVARETADGLQVIVADPLRGSLRAGVVPRGVRSFPSSKLEPLKCGPAGRPVAIALMRSRLVVVHSEAGPPTVTECDLETLQSKELLKGEPLRDPSSVAIGADGLVAVVDRSLRGVVVIRAGERPQLHRQTGNITMVRSDDRGVLYTLDNVVGGIVAFFGAGQGSQKNVEWLVPLPSESASFAAYKDVFYVTDNSGASRVQLPLARLSIPVPEIRPRQAAIAATRTFLATIDREASSIDVIERPLPAGVVLDPTNANPNEAWIQLLEYVASKNLLPRDRVPITPEDKTYEDVLRRNGVLLKVDAHPERVAVKPGRTRRLFCQLNATQCEGGFSANMQYVVIPQVAPEAVLQTETKLLDGKDVRTWVDDRVLLERHRQEVTDVYLAARNPAAASSLEIELLRRRMVTATPMSGRLGAGTILRIVDGREEIAGDVGQFCPGGTVQPSVTKTSLIPELSAPKQALPPEFQTIPGDRVRMVVDTWTRSALTTGQLEKCRPPESMSSDATYMYVVSEAIGAMDVTFEPTASPGRGGKPPAARPQRAAGPLYVGYKLVPVATLLNGVAVPISDPERIKPIPASKSPSPIWTMSGGSFTLPVTRWTTDVLLSAADFYSSSSELRKLLQDQRGLEVAPLERLDRAAYSADHTHVIQDPVKTALEAARNGLVKAITYDEALAMAAGTEDVTIGIVELSTSVNREHPGFSLDRESAWLDVVDGSGLQPFVPGEAANSAVALSLHRANTEREHGTHVAGVIGARRSLTLGMLPRTRLLLIPSDNAGGLKANIQSARDERVFLFNLSLGFTAGTPPDVIQGLHERMQQSWSAALFVVAAGNDGQNLNASGAMAPVAWSATLPNVLTVAASDESGENVLGQHQDAPDKRDEPLGSNFGSTFVDLLAPGKLVHSFGTEGYAFACGSSQAAPQVTATAAMLWNQLQTPEAVRARLIYTADWKRPNFDGKVWGGLLNVKRAVFEPLKNVYVDFDETNPMLHEVRLGVGAAISIDGDVHNRDGQLTPFRDVKFPFDRVLRLASLGVRGKYRIWLLSKGTNMLNVVEGTVSGAVKCRDVKQWDPKTQQFSIPVNAIDCSRDTISVTLIKDYVAAAPREVRFR